MLNQKKPADKAKDKDMYFSLFCFLTGLFTFIGLLYVLVKSGKPALSLVWNAPTGGVCPDFFETLKDAKYLRPYEGRAVYPALVYVLSAPLANLLMGNESLWDQTPFTYKWLELTYTQTGLILVFGFYIFVTLALVEFVCHRGKLSSVEKILFAFLFICSPAFIFMIDRGNIVILSALFIAIYLQSLLSENHINREIGLIALAFAACFKIYPAIFGLLLLVDKRYKDAGKAILYGVVLFFLPFALTGGIASFKSFLRNIFLLSQDYALNQRGFGFGYKINVSNMIDASWYWLFGNHANSFVLHGVAGFVLMISICIAIWNKTWWKKILALTCAMILVPDFSYIYTGVYLVLPVSEFMHDKREMEATHGEDILYLVLFSLEFAMFPYGCIMGRLPGDNKMSWSTIVLACSLVLSFCLLARDTIIDIAIQMKKPQEEL